MIVSGVCAIVKRFLRINGVIRQNRHEAVDKVKEAISGSGAWVLDFKMYANISICIFFEISARDVAKLHILLLETQIKLSDESVQALTESDNAQRSIPDDQVPDWKSSLEITFVHNEPDLIRDVPPLEL